MLANKGTFPSNWVKKGYVYVHPNDKTVYPDEFRTVDPSTFTPPSFKTVGPHRNWALEEPEVDSKGVVIDMMKRFVAKATAYDMYLKYPSPFEQYVGVLAQRKFAALSSPIVQNALKATLKIRIELTENGGDCWRIFTVPASTPLSVLHEQILGPIMGWSWGRHGYVFQDPRDGAVLGPKSAVEFADMKHANLKFNAYMDDTDVPLAAVLNQVGDYCWYVYDIADHWEHGLKVVEVLHEGDDGYGEIKLLHGRGACPAEDSAGLDGKGCEPYAKFLATYKTQPQLCKKALKAAAAAANYASRPFEYDPLIFHIDYQRSQLEAHLAGHAHLLLQPIQALKDVVPVVSENTIQGAHPHCWHCGDTEKPLMRCGKCNTASYCCRGCQVTNWKVHKDACKSLCDAAAATATANANAPTVTELGASDA